MKLFLRIIGILAVLALAFVVVAFFLPRTYHVERSIEINGAPLDVYEKVVDLKEWKAWGVWYERDPKMALTYSDPSVGAGAWSQWKSASEGDGKMTFTRAVPLQQVEYSMEFGGVDMTATGRITLQAGPGAVNVAWVGEGDLGSNPIMRWMGLFFDKMLGPDFEKSLAKLKRVVETPK